jgi:hypothetical protein
MFRVDGSACPEVATRSILATEDSGMNEQFTVGRVLGTGFRVWGRNLVPFLVITSLIYAPLIIWGVTLVSGGVTLEHLDKVGKFVQYSGGIDSLLNLVVSAALTYGVVMELQGQRASIGACIGTGLARFFPVLGVVFLSILCVLAGLLAIIVGAFVVLCMLFVATQASVIEKPGLIGALKRSRELTRGHRLQIFGLLIVLGIMNWGAQKIVENVMLPKQTVGNLDQFLKAIPAYLYVDIGRQLIITSIGAVMAAVSYVHLRQEKEGTSVAELARVFE